MKNVLPALLLAFATMAASQQSAQPSQPAQAQPAPTPASQKVIKDPTEYNAYMTAFNTTDPAAKGAAMEAFVKQYPQSIVLADALNEALGAYQQSKNQSKVEDIAKRILQISPKDLHAMVLVVAIDRVKASSGDPAALKESCADAQAGLQQASTWPKPEGMTDKDFEELRTEMTDVFNGASGFCVLQTQDYAKARPFYQKALQVDPASLENNYQLTLADLKSDPIDVSGFWYCAKTINLLQDPSQAKTLADTVKYCKAKYHNYHGVDDGWNEIVAAAGTENAPPAGFTVKPAPTPCEQAVAIVKQEKEPAKLNYGDQEFILSKAGCSADNNAAADKLWQALLGLQQGGQVFLKIAEVKVISSSKTSIDFAITDDNKAAKKADLHVVMKKPMLHQPAPGKTTDITGLLTSYTPDPFMFTMEKGELPAPKPVARRTAHKKTG